MRYDLSLRNKKLTWITNQNIRQRVRCSSYDMIDGFNLICVSLQSLILNVQSLKATKFRVRNVHFATNDASSYCKSFGCSERIWFATGNKQSIIPRALAVSKANLCSLNGSRFAWKWMKWMGSLLATILFVIFILISLDETYFTKP